MSSGLFVSGLELLSAEDCSWAPRSISANGGPEIETDSGRKAELENVINTDLISNDETGTCSMISEL